MNTRFIKGRSHSGNNGPNVIASRMGGFKQGTATKGGNNCNVLDSTYQWGWV